MQLRTTLLQLAVLLTGCGTGGSGALSNPSSDGGGDGSPTSPTPSTPSPGPTGCGGCNCPTPEVKSTTITADQACQIANAVGSSATCDAVCGAANHNKNGGYYCSLPPEYTKAAADAADAGGEVVDSGADAGPACPAWAGGVLVQCGYVCLGRRTDGIDEPACAQSLGEAFAGRAYLEEVAVHAFARLGRELTHHGAPAAILRDVRKARRDEVRHTAMMARLARRFGAVHRSPVAPRDASIRSLFDIAMENAVEGCVRETYGAVVGLIEAWGSNDADVARTMRSVSEDELRHAELSWAVARWILPKLTQEERTRIEDATRCAIDQLSRDGDERVVAMLDERVWRTAA